MRCVKVDEYKILIYNTDVSFAPCKVIRIPESRKFACEIQNTGHWNPEWAFKHKPLSLILAFGIAKFKIS